MYACYYNIHFHIGKRKPQMKDLENYVVPRWASQWRKLGTTLKIDHHLMDNIEHNYPTDCEQCCSKMLAEWLDSNPAACWEDLTTAVDNLHYYGKCAQKNFNYY